MLKRDTAAIQTYFEMYQACRKDYGMTPREVRAALNAEFDTDLKLPLAECYIRIAATHGNQRNGAINNDRVPKMADSKA